MHKLRKTNKGFTLIEVIVVMGVFLFIIGAAIGIFISVVQNQKKVLGEQQLINQISFSEEYMSKALRMAKTDIAGSCLFEGETKYLGYIYLLTRYDPTTELFRGIKFINQSDGDSCQEFFLDGGVLKESKWVGGVLSTNAVALTSSSLQINSVRFSINRLDGSQQGCGSQYGCGAKKIDGIQPRVTILLNVSISGSSQSNSASCSVAMPCTIAGQTCYLPTKKCVPERIIQTTVSRRNLNAQ